MNEILNVVDNLNEKLWGIKIQIIVSHIQNQVI